MKTEWLTQQITVEELRADIEGDFNWTSLLDAYHESDELWQFSSPMHYWNNLVGRAGIALVRSGEIVTSVVTIMN